MGVVKLSVAAKYDSKRFARVSSVISKLQLLIMFVLNCNSYIVSGGRFAVEGPLAGTKLVR